LLLSYTVVCRTSRSASECVVLVMERMEGMKKNFNYKVIDVIKNITKISISELLNMDRKEIISPKRISNPGYSKNTKELLKV